MHARAKLSAVCAIVLAMLCSVPYIAHAESGAMQALDTDHDGSIDQKEAEAAAFKAFKGMDLDHNGKLTQKEMANRLSPEDFQVADTDGDGTLDETEYMVLVRANFEAANPDGDGTIDQKELDSYAGQALLKLIR